ncbi:hypothetical protein [Spartinivicinus ruber]|uniref:hypothetical protein n=1 Tax=Spartinivicinus ruber TaxID=2683272 RepID=UPI0013D21118|nr:hypothetical protein [Spartinivicinus ruber]
MNVKPLVLAISIASVSAPLVFGKTQTHQCIDKLIPDSTCKLDIRTDEQKFADIATAITLWTKNTTELFSYTPNEILSATCENYNVDCDRFVTALEAYLERFVRTRRLEDRHVQALFDEFPRRQKNDFINAFQHAAVLFYTIQGEKYPNINKSFSAVQSFYLTALKYEYRYYIPQHQVENKWREVGFSLDLSRTALLSVARQVYKEKVDKEHGEGKGEAALDTLDKKRIEKREEVSFSAANPHQWVSGMNTGMWTATINNYYKHNRIHIIYHPEYQYLVLTRALKHAIDTWRPEFNADGTLITPHPKVRIAAFAKEIVNEYSELTTDELKNKLSYIDRINNHDKYVDNFKKNTNLLNHYFDNSAQSSAKYLIEKGQLILKQAKVTNKDEAQQFINETLKDDNLGYWNINKHAKAGLTIWANVNTAGVYDAIQNLVDFFQIKPYLDHWRTELATRHRFTDWPDHYLDELEGKALSSGLSAAINVAMAAYGAVEGIVAIRANPAARRAVFTAIAKEGMLPGEGEFAAPIQETSFIEEPTDNTSLPEETSVEESNTTESPSSETPFTAEELAAKHAEVKTTIENITANKRVIVFSGYSGLGYADATVYAEFNEPYLDLENTLSEILDKEIERYGKDNIVVVAGATEEGIGTVYGVAKSKNLTTLGIVSEEAEKYNVPIAEDCDNHVYVPDPSGTWKVLDPNGESYMVNVAKGNASYKGKFYSLGGGDVTVTELQEAKSLGIKTEVHENFRPNKIRVDEKIAKLKSKGQYTEGMDFTPVKTYQKQIDFQNRNRALEYSKVSEESFDSPPTRDTKRPGLYRDSQHIPYVKGSNGTYVRLIERKYTLNNKIITKYFLKPSKHGSNNGFDSWEVIITKDGSWWSVSDRYTGGRGEGPGWWKKKGKQNLTENLDNRLQTREGGESSSNNYTTRGAGLTKETAINNLRSAFKERTNNLQLNVFEEKPQNDLLDPSAPAIWISELNPISYEIHLPGEEETAVESLPDAIAKVDNFYSQPANKILFETNLPSKFHELLGIDIQLLESRPETNYSQIAIYKSTRFPGKYSLYVPGQLPVPLEDLSKIVHLVQKYTIEKAFGSDINLFSYNLLPDTFNPSRPGGLFPSNQLTIWQSTKSPWEYSLYVPDLPEGEQVLTFSNLQEIKPTIDGFNFRRLRAYVNANLSGEADVLETKDENFQVRTKFTIWPSKSATGRYTFWVPEDSEMKLKFDNRTGIYARRGPNEGFELVRKGAHRFGSGGWEETKVILEALKTSRPAQP